MPLGEGVITNDAHSQGEAMLKETGYQEKFEMLKPWLLGIIGLIKKDLKNEHLRIDRAFCKKFFLGKSPQLLSAEEMRDAYETDIASGNIGLAEFITSRWLLKNTDIYGFFEEKLRVIHPQFEEMNELPQAVGESLMEESVRDYGALKTYIFSVFNSVVFSEEVYRKLRALAEVDGEKREEEKRNFEALESIETLQKRHIREISSMQDRYEKKLSGMEKKYVRDMDAMKKQLSQLQKKLVAGYSEQKAN